MPLRVCFEFLNEHILPLKIIPTTATSYSDFLVLTELNLLFEILTTHTDYLDPLNNI